VKIKRNIIKAYQNQEIISEFIYYWKENLFLQKNKKMKILQFNYFYQFKINQITFYELQLDNWFYI
jgi:hypothetical protein